MDLKAIRDLKRQVARDVFAPLVKGLVDRVRTPRFDSFRLNDLIARSPLERLAIGIAAGKDLRDFRLAVRLQSQSDFVRTFLDRVRALAGGDLDVSFVGRVQPLNGTVSTDTLRKVCRPLVIGCSLGHVAATAGTLGMIARHRKTTRPVLLSNSHVLAQAGQAKIGDPITQPGRLDGGAAADQVGALLDFVPLKTAGSNHVDGAIAVVDEEIALEAGSIPGIGPLLDPPTEPLVPGQRVFKVGRTTGLTEGEITVTELDDIVVDYDIGTVVFDDQVEIKGKPGKPFSGAGDSGSLVLDAEHRPIALLFAGSPTANDGAGVSYANPIAKVMAALDLVKL
jgi:hypothetical protein